MAAADWQFLGVPTSGTAVQVHPPGVGAVGGTLRARGRPQDGQGPHHPGVWVSPG